LQCFFKETLCFNDAQLRKFDLISYTSVVVKFSIIKLFNLVFTIDIF